MKRRLAGAFALAMSSTVAVGCECTLVPCQNGLEVQLATPATVPFRIEVSSSGGYPGAAYVYECKNLGSCLGDRAFFPDFQPVTATISVITATDTTKTDVRPSYSEYQPNGSRCGPTCTVARVEIPFPGH
jgi:hypothetical protein